MKAPVDRISRSFLVRVLVRHTRKRGEEYAQKVMAVVRRPEGR
jgi:hypothetical protein